MPRLKNPPELLRFAKFFGRAVKHARHERRIKGSVFCEDIGISQQALSNIETGKIMPSFATLYRMSQGLNLPLWQLLRSAESIIPLSANAGRSRQHRKPKEVPDDETD